MDEIELNSLEWCLLYDSIRNAIHDTKSPHDIVVRIQNHLKSDTLPKDERWAAVVAKTMEGVEDAKERLKKFESDALDYREKFDSYMYRFTFSNMEAGFKCDWNPSEDEEEDSSSDEDEDSSSEEGEDMDAESD